MDVDVYIHTYTHMYVCVCLHVCVLACMYVLMHKETYKGIQRYFHTDVYPRASTRLLLPGLGAQSSLGAPRKRRAHEPSEDEAGMTWILLDQGSQ